VATDHTPWSLHSSFWGLASDADVINKFGWTVHRASKVEGGVMWVLDKLCVCATSFQSSSTEDKRPHVSTGMSCRC